MLQIDKISDSSLLHALAVDTPGLEAGSVQLWFRTGSANESADCHGAAHFLEHLFFKGTKHWPNSSGAAKIERIGGEINAFTSFDYTCFYINTPSEYLLTATDILLDMVAHPNIMQSDINIERKVVLEESLRSLDNPHQYAFGQLQNSFFSKEYRHPILGTKESIKQLSLAKIRHFWRENYHRGNAILLIGGNLKERGITYPKINQLIQRNKLVPGFSNPMPTFSLRNSKHIEIHQHDVRMCQLMVLYPAVPYLTPGSAAEDLAINGLGLGEGSQLYQDLVVNRGEANSASCSSLTMTKGAAHYLSISCPVEKFTKVTSSLTVLLRKVIEQGFKEDDLNKVKNQYSASKIYEQEMLESYLSSIGNSFAQTGTLDGDQRFLTMLSSCSTKEVNHALVKILGRQPHLMLQIPLEESISKYQTTMRRLQVKLEKLAVTKHSSASSTKKVKVRCRSKFDPNVQVFSIKKGINLIYRQNLITPTSVLHAYFKGGLMAEDANTNGIHPLIAAMITKGHKEFSYQKIKALTEQHAAIMSGFSGKNAYGITMHTLSRYFDSLTPHLLNSLLHPTMPSKMLSLEKELTQRAIEMQQIEPARICFSTFAQKIFSQHPYSMNAIGTKKSIKSISRKMILDRHLDNIKRGEMLFTYCGDLPVENILDALTSRLKHLPVRQEKAISHIPYGQVSERHTYLTTNREQAHIIVGIPIKHYNSLEARIISVMTTILSGQSSELFINFRDRMGLCYVCNPIQFLAYDGGYWGIYMATSHDKVKQASEAINHLLDKIAKKGVSKAKFERAKQMIKGEQCLNLQTNDDFASTYSVSYLQLKKLDFQHMTNQRIEDLSYETFNQKVMQLFAQKRYSTTVAN
jgi:zinc protease